MKKWLKILNGSFLVRLFIAVFLVTIYMPGIARAARPMITLSSDKQVISKGATLKVVADMRWKQTEDKNDLIILKVTSPSCPLLDLIDSKQTTSSQLKGDGVYAGKTMEYYFKAREKGEATIEPVIIEYLEGIAGVGQEVKDEAREILKSESINIKVVSYLNGLLKQLAIGSIIAVLAAVLIGFALFFKNRRSASLKNNIIENSDTHLEKEFLDGMKSFNKYIIEGDFRKYCSYTNSAISNYISKKYDISEPVKLANIKPDKLPTRLTTLYSEWINIDEKVRFSGYKPEKNEQDKIYRETVKYFKSLIQDEDPEEIIETVD